MQLPEVERAILEGLVRQGRLACIDADSLKRSTPFARDAIDEFLYRATRFAFDEGSWDHFERGVTQYLALTQHSAHQAPQLTPPEVYEEIAASLDRFEYNYDSAEPKAPGCHALTVSNHRLGESLLLTLGGDHNDGVAAAGKRVFSQMVAARISDGFVHPAIGSRLWAASPSTRTESPTDETLITIMGSMDQLNQRWLTAPDERAEIERTILDHAHRFSWARSAS